MASLLRFILVELDSKIVKPLKCIERQVSVNLREADIKLRPAVSNGLWCHILLPAILLVYTCFDNVTLLYKITTIISLGFLCYCGLFTIFLSSSNVVLKAPIYTGCLASSILASVILHVFLNQNLLFSMSVTILSTILFAWVLRLCITKCHNTFTLGEAMIVSEGVVLFAVMSVIKFLFEMHSNDMEMEFIGVIVYTVLSAVGLIVTALYFLNESQRNMKSLVCIMCSAAIFALLVLHLKLGFDCLRTILNYIFFEGNRMQLLTFWLMMLIMAVCALFVRTKLAVRATTVTRKTFHVLASFVFLSGISADVYLMTLAAGIGLGLMILVEALRKSGIEPISSALQSTFLIYCDEKDRGMFALTPIYLYVGLALPLLVVPNAQNRELELLSGVLSIGVGDTAASWFGSNLGLNKWPNSDKTLEGTVFNILTQFGTVYFLQFFGIVNSPYAMSRSALCACITGLVEARTVQIDNLVLPLAALATMQTSRLLY